MTADMIDFADARLRAHDHIVRGTAASGMIRAFAIDGRETVQEASTRHHASPVVTAALGRLMMGAQMMGAMSKDDDELLTISIRGDGPVAGLTVTANNKGQVKGYANHPNVWIPLRPDQHLDVGGALGSGTLSVVHDVKGAEPWSSTVPLATGEVAEDLTYYFAASEQVPTSVGLGVLVDRDLSVRQAGGFIVQLMPDCDDETTGILERNLRGISSVTDLLEEGMSPSELLNHVLDGLEFEELDALPAAFHCGCDRERAARCVMALGEAEIQDMIAKDEPADVHCHFCGKDYRFDPAELESLLVTAN